MKKMKKLSILFISVIVFSMILTGCQESTTYPDQDVTVIIPFNAGGGIDISARALFTDIDEYYDISFVVQNITGSSGTIGATSLYNSEADGYTIMAAGNGLNVANVESGWELTYEDYQLVAQYATSQLGLYVSADSPYETYEDLIEAARENPSEIKMGVLTGTVNHYAVLAIEESTGVEFQQIIVGGDSSPQPELLSGRVDAYVVAVSQNTAYIDSGDFRCLGVFAEEEVASLPGVPTFYELGIEEDYQLSFGIWAPEGTPDEIVEIISDMVEQTCEDEEFQTSMEALGYVAAYLDTEDYINRYAESYESIVELSEKLSSDGEESSIDPYVGAYAMPLVIGVIVVVLGLMEIIRKIIAKEKFEPKIVELFKGKTVFFFIAILIYALALGYVGYVVSTTSFLMITMYKLHHGIIDKKKELKKITIISIALAVITFLFFTKVAGIVVPTNIFGF